MFRGHSDLPLAKDSSSRFLPWLIAVMVFLAAVAVAGAMATEIIVQRWHRDISGTITVQIMPVAGLVEVARPETEKRLETALRILETTPGVVSAKALDMEKTAKLLEPWLGPREVFADLPLPRLIDVTLGAERDINLESLSRRLSEAVPGSSLDDHQLWLGKLVRFAYGLEMLAATVVVLTSIALMTTVVYATRTGLAVHHSVIEVLHMIGAQDEYIARQFGSSSLWLGLKGGFFGMSLAIPAILGIGWLSGRIEGGLVPEVTLLVWHWVVIGLLPVVAALLARFTASITVHRTLSRMV